MVKIGHTHTQDATPLTLGQEWSAYAGMLTDDLERIVAARDGVYRLALGGTAVGAGINSAPGLAEALELAPQQRRQKTLEAPTAPLQACPACGALTITLNPQRPSRRTKESTHDGDEGRDGQPRRR
jgi:fumarate hydratase class II